jgi:ATP-binding cassette subfamily B protein
LDAPIEIDNRTDAVRVPRAKGVIEFQNVSFGYKPADPVLENISFKSAPGQCVAIVGPIGTGKSTLLSLIPRFYDPTSGTVLLDGIDIKKIDVDDLRHNIGIVFQESFLFSNTIAANIAFGHPEATPGMIERAAKIAAAHDFIMELPKGYDTVIGEQGSGLSGGQRQRLAIARAILLEPSIFLLDDATSALDPSTEHEILQAMDNAMEGRTTFVVASRLSTLRRADLVIVLERGRIVQMGTHQELLKADGYYSDIAELQVADPSAATAAGITPAIAPAPGAGAAS